MRKVLTIAAAIWMSLGLSAQNPISPAGVFIPDPSAKVGPDGKVYVYGSLDVEDGRYCSDTYHLLSSSDMVHWELTKDIFKHDSDVYAPDIAYKDGRWYLYYCCPDGSEWVAESRKPYGPFRHDVKIEGPDQIDPQVFIDDDGQAYYFWGQFSGKGAKLNPDMKTLDWSSYRDGLVTEDGHFFHEGSYVFKRGEWYYYTYAAVTRRFTPTCLAYAMSKSPLGPYEYKGVIIDNLGCDPYVWNDHGSVIEFDGKWYVFYHRSTHGDRYMRKACVEPLEFREDGTIVEAEMTTQGTAGPLDGYAALDAYRACLLDGHVRISMMDGRDDREMLSRMRDGDWAAFKYLDFGTRAPRKVIMRVRSINGGTIGIGFNQLYWGNAASVDVPAGNVWTEVSADIDGDYAGVRAVLVRTSGVPDEDLFDVDWIRFE